MTLVQDGGVLADLSNKPLEEPDREPEADSDMARNLTRAIRIRAYSSFSYAESGDFRSLLAAQNY